MGGTIAAEVLGVDRFVDASRLQVALEMIGNWYTLYRIFRFRKNRFPMIEDWSAANDDQYK